MVDPRAERQVLRQQCSAAIVQGPSLTKDALSVCAVLLDNEAFAAGLGTHWGATALLRRPSAPTCGFRATVAQDHPDAKMMVPPRAVIHAAGHRVSIFTVIGDIVC